jgi:hypothetical protein
MSACKSINVTRSYEPAPDDCARALQVLLEKSWTKMAARPEPDDRNAAKESTNVCDAT